ncbi:MAG: hypothetical protein IJT70_04845 [Clostridia bacterium]|nr:hypothetical protein [Clostridia bacterium]
MKKNISLSYIVFLIVLAAAVCLFASCAGGGEAATEESTAAEAEPTFPPESDGALSGCLFIGDSRILGLHLADALPGADFFCSVGMSVFSATTEVYEQDGFRYSLGQILAEREYDKVYIMLGLNEIGYDFDDIVEMYEKLISYVQGFQPEAKIIVMANTHLTTEFSSSDELYNNENVDLLNERLCELTDGSRVLWLDSSEVLDDESGGLKEEYAEKDGEHPNWKGDRMWGEWIVSQNANY